MQSQSLVETGYVRALIIAIRSTIEPWPGYKQAKSIPPVERERKKTLHAHPILGSNGTLWRIQATAQIRSAALGMQVGVRYAGGYNNLPVTKKFWTRSLNPLVPDVK